MRTGAVLAIFVMVSVPTFAGMRPHPTLTDLARTRIEVISFFVVALLLLALPVKWAWNALSKDFMRLPRLNYGRALGLVTLWGLLFIIVLAMISGARELMTPGAWEKRPDGGYRLADGGDDAEPAGDDRRRAALQRLHVELQRYRTDNAGQLPVHEFDKAVSDAAWESPHPSRQRYVYTGSYPSSRRAKGIVAYEPACFGEERFALRADGSVERLNRQDIWVEVATKDER